MDTVKVAKTKPFSHFEKHHLARTFKFITWYLSLALFFITCFALIMPSSAALNGSNNYSVGMFLSQSHKLSALGIITSIIFTFLLLSYCFHIIFWKIFVSERKMNTLLLIVFLLACILWILMMTGTYPDITIVDGKTTINFFMHFTDDDHDICKFTAAGGFMVAFAVLGSVGLAALTYFDFKANRLEVVGKNNII